MSCVTTIPLLYECPAPHVSDPFYFPKPEKQINQKHLWNLQAPMGENKQRYTLQTLYWYNHTEFYSRSPTWFLDKTMFFHL